MLIGTFGRDQVSYNRKNSVIFNNTEQYILKNTIINFGFNLKIPKFYLYIIEYKADLMYCFYRVFKKAETYLDILNVKVKI